MKTVAAPPIYDRLRLTVPARDALQAAGNRVRPEGATSTGAPLYRVVLRRPPVGMEACLIQDVSGEPWPDQHEGLRLQSEPPFPGEWPATAVAWYVRGQWVPCPSCGGALVWYEAGYVPGYRLCTSGHHAQLSADGRSAEEK